MLLPIALMILGPSIAVLCVWRGLDWQNTMAWMLGIIPACALFAFGVYLLLNAVSYP
jgi:hypothetical protein